MLARTQGGVTDTYTYDNLNQILTKSYSDGITPGVTYTYIVDWLKSVAVAGGTVSTNLTFDGLGRVSSSSQKTNGSTYTFPVYFYNLADSLTSVTTPTGRIITTAYDNANRPTSVQGTLGTPTTYASVTYYAPQGAIGSMTLANGLVAATGFNSRLQAGTMTLGTVPDPSSVWSLVNMYSPSANNGNVQSQNLTFPTGSTYTPMTISTVYTPDGVNRLLTASESASNPSNLPCPSWFRGYNYYAGGHGNRLTQTYCGQGMSPDEPGSFNSSNQISSAGWTYDARGNVTKQADGSTMAYDAENRQISFTSGGVPTSYYYDGEGHRVMAQNPAGTTVFVYDAAGDLAAEYSSQPQPSLCATCYLTKDHLGSTRVVTDEHGCAVYRADYLPFGELILTSSTSPRFIATSPNCSSPIMANGYLPASPVRPQFTGKERDAETGLDYFGARYMSSAQGRFTSPDAPFNDQDPSNPQSWNLYSYVRNNPLVNTDPTGQDCVTTSNQTDTSITVSVAAGSCGKQGGTFVNGTVDTNSLTYNGKSLDFGYTGYDGSAGAFSKNLGAPVYEFPGIEGPANQAGAAHIAGSQALINEFAKQAAFQALGGIAGHFIGAGIDAALAARAGASAATPAAELTAHAAQRLAQRGITRAMVEEAVETAQQTGAIKSNVGQYGTIQHVYQGTNGISVVVETEGRNADKVVTAFRTGSKP